MDGHTTVLLEEAIEALVTAPGGVYVDATYGRGGHSRAILDRLDAGGRLIAVDRDPAAIAHARALGDPRLTVVHAPFAELAAALRELATPTVDGVLFDLGVSSPQLDDPARGFSFMHDGPLDMRMDTSRGETAADWLARVDEAELARVLYEYGEERFSRRIARAIVARRTEAPLRTSAELADVIAAATPRRDRHKHPATRSFQAIRIAVNGELEQIEAALDQALDALAPGGRLVVISFHSLEDRLVKRFIATHSGAAEQGSRRLPPPPDSAPVRLRDLGRTKPGRVEVEANPRARSAVMRVAERL